MVFTRPKREARRDASSVLKSPQRYLHKENDTECSRVYTEPQVEPIGCEALHHKTTGKRVQGEQTRKFHHHSVGMPDPKKRPIVPGKADPSCGKLTSVAGERRVKSTPTGHREPRTEPRQRDRFPQASTWIFAAHA